jgi:hypothetical protein
MLVQRMGAEMKKRTYAVIAAAAVLCAPPVVLWSLRAALAVASTVDNARQARATKEREECVSNARRVYDLAPRTKEAWWDYQQAFLACGEPMPEFWHECQTNNPARPRDWAPLHTKEDPYDCGDAW